MGFGGKRTFLRVRQKQKKQSILSTWAILLFLIDPSYLPFSLCYSLIIIIIIIIINTIIIIIINIIIIIVVDVVVIISIIIMIASGAPWARKFGFDVIE